MKHSYRIHLSVAAVALLWGCGAKDANQPQTVQQQAEMAKGHEPTKEELNKAMARFKTPGQDGPAPTGPNGAAPASPNNPPQR